MRSSLDRVSEEKFGKGKYVDIYKNRGQGKEEILNERYKLC